MIQDTKFLKFLRYSSLTEGVTALALFLIAMPMKYLMDMPEAVSWPGRVHGAIFTLVVILSVIGINRIPISKKLVIKMLVASFIPFGPFVVDRELRVLSHLSET